MATEIDTDAWSSRYRTKAIDLEGKRLLITNFSGTEQEQDLTVPPNCSGFGRIRHFRRATSQGWPTNPLPLDPACAALQLEELDVMRAQAFQNAACNWRCWYCFVPFDLLSANPQHSAWLTAEDLVNLYLDQPDPPKVIDLTGGEASLVPEWLPWMMHALRLRNLEQKVYLWSDDNLSNDYLWRYLSDEDLSLVSRYKNYGRVCCFKGFDDTSFAFNTCAASALFDRQFQLFERLLRLGLDLYAYVTLTTPIKTGIEEGVKRFFDRLQSLNEKLPLRTIPLEIQIYTTVTKRLEQIHDEAVRNQKVAIEAWRKELENRYTSEDRATNISKVVLYKNNN